MVLEKLDGEIFLFLMVLFVPSLAGMGFPMNLSNLLDSSKSSRFIQLFFVAVLISPFFPPFVNLVLVFLLQ